MYSCWDKGAAGQVSRQLLTLLLLLLLLQSNAEQARLRELRGELNAARAELTEAQQQLVAARGEEAKMRKVLEEEPQKDRTLGALGCCWWCSIRRAICLCDLPQLLWS
jgi:hypothetical protein